MNDLYTSNILYKQYGPVIAYKCQTAYVESFSLKDDWTNKFKPSIINGEIKKN